MGTTPWPYPLAAWTRRRPLAIAGTASAGPYTSVVVGADDDLWGDGGMQADGDDLRVWSPALGASGGVAGALVDFSNDAPDTAARTIGNFIVEMSNSAATRTELHWLYWGNSAAANAEGTVTATNATGSRFGGRPDPARTILCVPEAPGATTPAQRFSKKQDEEFDLWWDLSPALGEAPPVGGRPASAYQLCWIDWNTTDGTGIYSAESTSEETWTDAAETKFAEVEGRLYVAIRLAPAVGSSGVNYVVKLRGVMRRTDAVRGGGNYEDVTFEYRALMQLIDVT